MVDRGMSGRSGSNMWMNGPCFLFCSLYYAWGGEGKKKVVHCVTKHRNQTKCEQCRGLWRSQESNEKLPAKGPVCVCVRLLHPHQPLSKASIENDHKQDSTFGAQPNSTVAIQAKGQISAGAALFEDLDLTVHALPDYHFGYKSKE